MLYPTLDLRGMIDGMITSTFFCKRKNQKGVSLVELLIVIAILGILIGVAIVSVADVRAKSRDAQRRLDLKQIQLALEKYANYYGTYQVAGTGAAGYGDGYIGLANQGSYTSITVIQGLKNAGFLNKSVNDDPRQAPVGYMLYFCGADGYALSATLERPTASDIANIQTTCNGTGSNGTYTAYGKNYAISK